MASAHHLSALSDDYLRWRDLLARYQALGEATPDSLWEEWQDLETRILDHQPSGPLDLLLMNVVACVDYEGQRCDARDRRFLLANRAFLMRLVLRDGDPEQQALVNQLQSEPALLPGADHDLAAQNIQITPAI